MDEYLHEENQGDSLVKKLKIGVIVLGAALVVLLAFFVHAHRENRANMQIISDEKELLQQELVDLSSNYDGLKTDNDSLNARLTIEQEKIAGLMEKMKTFRANSYAEINRYKQEVGTLKTIMRGYVVQIDSLNRANQQLRAENSEVKKQITWVRERNKNLEEKTTRMEETLELAATLAIEQFRLYPINKREKETQIRKCAQLKAEFTITKNVTAKRGARMIYLRVTRPDGNAIVGEEGATFKYQNVAMDYSARREIVYEGERLEVSIYWPNDGSLDKGKYTADLFSDNQLIGTGEFILK
ncbi:MAG: hypothetical protein LBK12_09145 [Odoribacteraceae bacterium]|jgi:FtsZ-binding cell division protein ZapB|nr:hypothetical protein [Odoribacteraceae bacterium]